MKQHGNLMRVGVRGEGRSSSVLHWDDQLTCPGLASWHEKPQRGCSGSQKSQIRS